MTLAATFAFITELHDLGLQAAQGMYLADRWFWTRDNGLISHDMCLLRVKAPGTSSGPWDYYDLVQTFKGDAAWLPRGESSCSP